MTPVVVLQLVLGNGGGCCSGNNNTILQPSQSPSQVSELVGYEARELKSIPEALSLEQDVELQQSLLLLRKVIQSLI